MTTYHAHLLACFQYVGHEQTPVLMHFRVSSERHDQITTDWSRRFHALVLSAHSEISYAHAVRELRQVAERLMPRVGVLVKWG